MKRTSALFAGMIVLCAAHVLGADRARAEGFFDVYVGGVFTPDTDQTVSAMGMSASKTTEYKNSFISGGRGGYWLESFPYVGFALTGGYFNVKEKVDVKDESRIEFDMVPTSALLMLRYPLLKSSEYPRGQLYPYLGIGPAVFVAKAKIQVTSVPPPNKFRDTDFAPGLDLRAGATIFHPTQAFSVFLEYRFTYVGSMDFHDTLSGVPVDWKLGSMATQSFLFGAGYHF